MKSVNKIKERDMDPEFLLSLINNTKTLNIAELLSSYVRKDEVIPVSSLSSEYVSNVENSLKELRESIADIKEQYRKVSVPISTDDFDSSTSDILSAITYFLRHVKVHDDATPIISTSPEGDRVIIITDSDGSEYNVVIPFTYDTESGFSAIDKQRLEIQITTLQNQVSNLASTVNVLKQKVLGSSTSTDYSIDSVDDTTLSHLMSVISSQEDRISLLESKLTKLQKGKDDVSINDITDQLEQHDNDITALNMKTAKKIQYTNLSVDLQQKIDDVSDITRRLSLVESNKMNIPVIEQSGYLFYSVEEGNTVKSRVPILKACVCNTVDDIIVAQDNNEDFIINLITGEGYQFNSLSKAYDVVQVEKNPDYEYMLILNTRTEVIEYFIFEGSLIKLDSTHDSAALIHSAGLTVKKVTIAAGSNFRVERLNNLKKFPPLVLVYDSESGSRSIGKYINGEAVITISHDESGFVLYNDSLHELEVLVMAGD